MMPPVLLAVDGQQQSLACFESSIREADAMRGHCVSDRYHYPVEFGSGMGSGVGGNTAPPFLCGDIVVSVHADHVQARRFTDGRVVSRIPGTARMGSRCLGGNRMLLVERRSVAIYDIPRFRQRWRKATVKPIWEVAACSGNKLAVLAADYTTVLLIDLPSDIVPGP
jgi:hypothetical protein